ncbi:MAG: M15 family metallopeptidase [Gorillibacterium sp.]|nr:M15 family metallopeptidase [Gorillibacterium sp.]
MYAFRNSYRLIASLLLAVLLLTSLAACKKESAATGAPTTPTSQTDKPSADSSKSPSEAGDSPSSDAATGGSSAVPVDTDSDSIAVLVNKQLALPDNYKPDDLVYPNVHFIFDDKIEKRMMRKEAATALEDLFAGAEADGIFLGGVSAFRSQATQTVLFQNYVKKDGEEKAKMYSSVPGHSEHQTGLAIDVSGSTGVCAAEFCFEGTPEAEWLAAHAHEYGYIIRYLKGKEDITGFDYEPWHIRYVGTEMAADIYSRGITLEEYYGAVPVTN